MNKYLIEKKIEYLSQLQENEKFKLDVIRNGFQIFLFCVIPLWISLMSTAIMFAIAGVNIKIPYFMLLVSGIIMIIWIVYLFCTNHKMVKIEKSIEKRGGEIEKMYG